MLFTLLLMLQDSAVDRLGSEDMENRDRAQAELRVRGRAAVPELLRAARGEDAEVRARAMELLRAARPFDWILDHLDDPLALDLFAGSHRRNLIPEWSDRVRLFFDRPARGAARLNDLEATAAANSQVVFRVGTLRRMDGAAVRRDGWVPMLGPAPARIDLEGEIRDGVIIVGLRGELGPEKPFSQMLLARLLENPQDAQAACLMADLVDDALAEALEKRLGRDDKLGQIAFEVLTYYHAKYKPKEALKDAYLSCVGKRLESADWEFLCPASNLAVECPDRFAAALKEAYSSGNRWARYFGAAVAHRTKSPALYDAALYDLMREDQPDMQREALFAAFAIARRETMDFRAMVQAALGQEDRSPAIWEFKKVPEKRLGLELVRLLPRERDFAQEILGVFKDEEVINAFCKAVEAEFGASYAHEFLSLLTQYAEGGNRARPIEVLWTFFERSDDTTGLGAARSLGVVLRQKGLNRFERALKSDHPTIRRRGVEGLYRIPAGKETPEFRHIIDVLTRFVGTEKDPDTFAFARDRLDWLLGKEQIFRSFGRGEYDAIGVG